LLAGRKLLLADDSVTIQKVIELTFADEGVRVIAFGNGDEALAKLQEVAPDVVLADVFMPGKNGYQVCEHIKQNEQLKHIPVMLLVGSFEPFDEAEARRVGADDILTKPFQSIRRLIDRVGALVGGRPPEEEVPTAELPQAAERRADEERLDTDELAITTADTRPLPPEWKTAIEANEQPGVTAVSGTGEPRMEPATETRKDAQFETDSLLDLSYIEPVDVSAGDDFVLDLDVEEAQNGSAAAAVSYQVPSPRAEFVEPEVASVAPETRSHFEYTPEPHVEAPSSFDTTMDVTPMERIHDDVIDDYSATAPTVELDYPAPVAHEPVTSEVQAAAPITSAGQLSPEMIDAIARRAVEMMSDKVVREIAWEVVPELAELLIKRQLEEKESQPK
jgi:CheY-like chemotaxis protein